MINNGYKIVVEFADLIDLKRLAYEHWYGKIPATEKRIPENAKCR